jgi:hypothetical protein
MSFGTHLIKTRESFVSEFRELRQCDLAIFVLVHEIQDSLCDVVCLLLVLDIILHGNNMSMSSVQLGGNGTHFGLLLRVDMMNTVYSFYFFPVPNAVPGSKAIGYKY